MNKDELYKKYIVENLSRSECAKFFNVSEPTIKRAVIKYGFRKTQEQMDEIKSRVQKVFIPRDVLYDLYIDKNLSLKECAKELGYSPVVVKRRLQDFNIKKTGEKFREIHRTHANPTEETLKKREETVIKNWGVKNVSQAKEVKDKKTTTTQKNWHVDNPFQAEEIKNQISEKMMADYGVPYSCMREECRKFSGNDSTPNSEFATLLNKYGIKYEREFALDSYSYDFKVNDILIEIDPTIFHNSTFAPVGKAKDKNYHFNKTRVAKKHGYKCIHIFDWDDVNKIINVFLLNKERVYARKCEIRDINIKDAKLFLNNNHLQGYAKDNIRIGLYCKNELVEIMTFGKPRYNKNYDYELVRLCAVKNIIGGTEKLLNHFVKEYKPKNIISYCDLSKFSGKIYTKLGFKKDSIPQPSKHWYNMKTKQHITDNLLRKRGFDQLFKTSYGKGTSNEELMLKNGFVEIYDCGQASFVL